MREAWVAGKVRVSWGGWSWGVENDMVGDMRVVLDGDLDREVVQVGCL
jgi:hypothetical protein